MAYHSRKPKRSSKSTKKSYGRRATRSSAKKRSAPKSWTVKHVLEIRQASPVSRPDLTGVTIEKPGKRAKL